MNRLLALDTTKIVYIGQSGKCWHLAGPNMGAEHVTFGTDPTGMIFGPEELLFSEGARQDGATFLRSVKSKRELDFEIQIGGNDPRHHRAVHDAFFRDVSVTRPGRFGVYTKYAGWRWLQVRLGEPPSPKWGKDPALRHYQAYDLMFIADDPLWWSFKNTYEWSNTLGVNETDLALRNAADQVAWPKYVMNGPGRWFIEDPIPGVDSFDEIRMVMMPMLETGDTLMLDTHPRHPTLRLYNAATGENGRNVWAQLKGRRMLYSLPAWQTTNITVRIEQGTAQSSIMSIVGPRFERPW